MKGYKLKNVYWIFGKQKNFTTKKLELVLIPFIYNKEGTKIKFLDDGDVPFITLKDKLLEDDIIEYCTGSLSIYDAEILRSAVLYSAYLKLTPKILLTAAEKELITKTNPRNVRAFVIRDRFENDLYSAEDVLKFGKKCKKAFIKHTVLETKKEEQERKQQALKDKELVEDTREF